MPINGKHQLKVCYTPELSCHARKEKRKKKYCCLPPCLLENNLLQLNLINIESDEFECIKDTEFELYTRYQTKVHNDPPADRSEFNDFLCKSPIKVSDVIFFCLISCCLHS